MLLVGEYYRPYSAHHESSVWAPIKYKTGLSPDNTVIRIRCYGSTGWAQYCTSE